MCRWKYSSAIKTKRVDQTIQVTAVSVCWRRLRASNFYLIFIALVSKVFFRSSQMSVQTYAMSFFFILFLSPLLFSSLHKPMHSCSPWLHLHNTTDDKFKYNIYNWLFLATLMNVLIMHPTHSCALWIYTYASVISIKEGFFPSPLRMLIQCTFNPCAGL